MGRGNSLTISVCNGRPCGLSAGARRRSVGALGVLACLLLAACTIEVGPPPASDPPLVSQAAKGPPPPAQPSEPQPWSRGLDFDSAPVWADREQMVEGLVAAEAETRYSEQRLTFESALNPEKPPSEAELTLQRAQARASAAGLPPPPQVTAAPVTEVEAAPLPAAGGTAAEAASPQRASRLPPPPKFPPLEAEKAELAAAPADAAPAAVERAEPATPESWEQRNSRLPAPPKFPPMVPTSAEVAAVPPEAESAAAEAGAVAFAAAAWDAPPGTILVQVSAVPDSAKVAEEWEHLRTRYPQVLKPLRLVVDEAKLGERGVFYRVQAGAFGSREGAAAACSALIDQGQACFVVVR